MTSLAQTFIEAIGSWFSSPLIVGRDSISLIPELNGGSTACPKVCDKRFLIYSKRGYYRGGDSQRCKTYITRLCYFRDTSAIYIAIYRGCYFRLGVIFAINTIAKNAKLSLRENVHVYSTIFAIKIFVYCIIMTSPIGLAFGPWFILDLLPELTTPVWWLYIHVCSNSNRPS